MKCFVCLFVIDCVVQSQQPFHGDDSSWFVMTSQLLFRSDNSAWCVSDVTGHVSRSSVLRVVMGVIGCVMLVMG
jgi:hypothetical protein